MYRKPHRLIAPEHPPGGPRTAWDTPGTHRRPSAGVWTATLLAGLGIACAHSEKKPVAEGPGQMMSMDPEDLAAHMAVHDAQGVAMRDAVVRGDLNDLAAPAEWMAEHMADKRVPPEWQEPVRRMRVAAQAVARSDNVTDAARSLAELAGTCGHCHAKISSPELFMTDPPAEASDTRGRMVRHVWATDRMWEGIIGPSEAAWVAGSEILADAPLRPDALAPPGALPEEAGRLAKRVHTLGVDAHRASTRVERVRIYGEILGTCAHCHRALGRGP